MSTHNICFHAEIRIILCGYSLLCGVMNDDLRFSDASTREGHFCQYDN